MSPENKPVCWELYGILFAANCRSLDCSATTKTHPDFFSNYQNRDYAPAIRKAHHLFSNFRVTFNTHLLIRHTPFLKVMLSLSTKGAARLGVDDNLFRYTDGLSLGIQLIELLDNKLDIIITFLLPDTGFLELLIPPGLGEVYPNQLHAAIRA